MYEGPMRGEGQRCSSGWRMPAAQRTLVLRRRPPAVLPSLVRPVTRPATPHRLGSPRNSRNAAPGCMYSSTLGLALRAVRGDAQALERGRQRKAEEAKRFKEKFATTSKRDQEDNQYWQKREQARGGGWGGERGER